VGLPGEHIEQRRGRLQIEGAPLEEPYIPSSAYLEPKPDQIWTLDEDSYLVLGDARDDSLDSRAFGPVRRAEVVGVAARRLWPPSRWFKSA
jgi:signal peptidase I